MVKSTGFRLASILIPTLLLVLLGWVVFVVLRDNPVDLRPAALQTPVTQPALTIDIPTPTSGPAEFLISTAQPVRLDGTLRYAEAELAFGPPQGYALDLAEQAAILTATDDSPASGTILVLRNEDPAAYAPAAQPGSADDNAALFQEFVRFYAAQDGFNLGESAPLTIGGQPGWAIDLVSQDAGDFGGRVALARPHSDRLFVMIGVGPTQIWRSQGLADYMAVLETVTFLDLDTSETGSGETGGETGTGSDVTAIQSTPTPPPPTPTSALTATPTTTPTAAPTAAPTVTPTPEESDDHGSTVAIPPADTPQPQPTAIPQPEQLSLDSARWSALTNGNFVNRLAVRDGTLWAATTGGAIAWNLASENHAKFTTADGLGSNHLTSVTDCDLPDFGVVFGSDQGLHVYAPETGSWRALTAENGDLTANDVADIYCDPQAGYLAVLYAREGVDVYAAETQVWTHLALNTGAPDSEVGQLRRIAGTGAGSALWIAAQRGLVLLQGDLGTGGAPSGPITLNTFTPDNSPLTSESITAVTPAGDNAAGNSEVWLAGNGTVYRTDGDTWEVFAADTLVDGQFPQGRINGLRVDPDGLLWIASDQANLCRFDPAQSRCMEFFVNEPGMVQGPLSSLVLDDQGRAYFATQGNGVSRLEDGSWRGLVLDNQLSLGNTVRSLALDSEGALWIAANSGASRVNPATLEQPVYYTPANSPLPFADVTVVGASAQGRSMWFGANGVALFNGTDWRVFDAADNLAAAPIQAIAADGVGRTWLGSQGAGISIWTGSNFFNLTAANGLPSEDITALASAGDVVWIGTRGGGLLRFQNNQLRFFTTRDTDLPSNTITALAVHPDGGVLVGTDRGLARFADDELRLVTGLPPGVVTALAVPTASSQTTADFWVTLDGDTLYAFQGATWAAGTFYQIEPAAAWSHAPITSLLQDPSGALWIGFQRGGLARYVP